MQWTKAFLARETGALISSEIARATYVDAFLPAGLFTGFPVGDTLVILDDSSSW